MAPKLGPEVQVGTDWGNLEITLLWMQHVFKFHVCLLAQRLESLFNLSRSCFIAANTLKIFGLTMFPFRKKTKCYIGGNICEIKLGSHTAWVNLETYVFLPQKKVGGSGIREETDTGQNKSGWGDLNEVSSLSVFATNRFILALPQCYFNWCKSIASIKIPSW